MQTLEGTMKKTLALLMLALGFAVIGTAAMAQRPADIAHDALRQKIVTDAGDRRGVKFITTHSTKLDAFRRSVTGEGVFRRKGKSSQHFSYDAVVNTTKKIATKTNYNIH